MLRNRKNLKSELSLILVTLLWGATFVVIKEALNDISPMLFIAIRFTLASIILIPFIINKFDTANLLPGFILGGLLFIGFATQTIGLKFTTATKSGFLTGTAVIIIPLLQIIITKKRPSKGIITGIVFVIIGIALLSANSTSVNEIFNDLIYHFNIGDTLTLICALFFALYVIYLDVQTKKYNFWMLLFVQLFTMSILAIIFMLIFSLMNIQPIEFRLTNNSVAAILYTSVFATLVTTALQTKYQKYVTPAKAGLIFSLEPLFAVLFAFFLLGENLTNFGLVGASLIFLGLIISEIFDPIKLNEK